MVANFFYEAYGASVEFFSDQLLQQNLERYPHLH